MGKLKAWIDSLGPMVDTETIEAEAQRSIVDNSSAFSAGVVVTNMTSTPTEMVTFAQMVSEAFNKNADVRACIGEIAAAINGLTLQTKAGDNVIENMQLQALLARPNALQTGDEFMEMIISHLLLAGNAYVVGAGELTNTPPRSIWLLNPRHVTIKAGDEVNPIAGYWWKKDEKGEKFYTFEEVLHLKELNPDSVLVGQSPLISAALQIDFGNEGMEWDLNLVRTGGLIGGILTVPDDLASDPADIDRLKSELSSKFSGSDNPDKFFIARDGITYEPAAWSPRDAQWLEGLSMSTQKICSVLRVPPEIIGIHEMATYSNYQEARQSFMTECVLPYSKKILSGLNYWLVPKFSTNLSIEVNMDEIAVLQKDASTEWKRVADAFKVGLISREQALIELGIEDNGTEFATQTPTEEPEVEEEESSE